MRINKFLFVLFFLCAITINAECFLSSKQYGNIEWSLHESSIYSVGETELNIVKENNIISLHYKTSTKEPVDFKKGRLVIFSKDEKFVKTPKVLNTSISGVMPTIVYSIYEIINGTLEKCIINDAKSIEEVLKEVKYLKTLDTTIPKVLKND